MTVLFWFGFVSGITASRYRYYSFRVLPPTTPGAHSGYWVDTAGSAYDIRWKWNQCSKAKARLIGISQLPKDQSVVSCVFGYA